MNIERKSGIYMWTSPSGKSYIGQSVNLQKRKCAFLCFGDIYGGQKINRARKKYNNKRYWKYKVLEYCDIDDLDEREEYYISLYNTMRKGYNCESGGNENKIVSDETKQKQSEAMKGENNPLYGKHLTEEHKSKLSKAHDKRKIPVSQYTIEGVFIASYESIHEAQRLTNINKNTISRCCRGIQKTAGGFKWAYKNPPLLKE